MFLTVILQPFPPANAIFTGIAFLFAVCSLFRPQSADFCDIYVFQTIKDVRASYDALVVMFGSFGNFLSRLKIYIGVSPTPALTNALVKIIVQFLSTLALVTKEVKQGKFSEFVLVCMTLD